MNSFYTQQYQPPFSAPQQNLHYIYQPYPSYTPKRMELPINWITTGQPLPSAAIHIRSAPPTQPEVPAFKDLTQNFAIVEILDVWVNDGSVLIEQNSTMPLAPPTLFPQLSDPAFLLEKDEPKLVPMAPPKMEFHLSDPSFLLETPFAEQSECTDSGSTSSGELVQKTPTEQNSMMPVAPLIVDQQDHDESELPKVQTPPAVNSNEWSEVGTVSKQRKKRKTIEPGNVYRTKRSVKVTKHEHPLSHEVWTVSRGIDMEVTEVNGKRASVYCVVEYWSKYQNKTLESPRRKQIHGWITVRDFNGWVL